MKLRDFISAADRGEIACVEAFQGTRGEWVLMAWPKHGDCAVLTGSTGIPFEFATSQQAHEFVRHYVGERVQFGVSRFNALQLLTAKQPGGYVPLSDGQMEWAL